ncbi:MAG: hypothetical protein IJ762_04200 [Bacteroidaceae bacterium]|nr:hypothetical protein [Bacteroidaceae bacterium]MBR1788379.1 hypothetical protein [Bacteroidaceae bacterium]
MIIAPADIKSMVTEPAGEKTPAGLRSMDTEDKDDDVVLEVISSPEGLGTIRDGMAKHYYSSGAFNLIQLVLYILRQTGPAHLFLATYSISDRSITTLRNHIDRKDILSIRFLIDNRVRSISPKSFDYLLTAFPGQTRCRTLHAKVALVWNDQWHISVVGSQNATHNPKLERGIIHTSREIFNFDKQVLEYEFEHGTTESIGGLRL